MKFYLFFGLVVIHTIVHAINGYVELVDKGLILQGETPLLHLGCGTNHLDGYINIDFPLSNHTVQSVSGADYFADITKLQFPNQSVSVIRSHHFFEHFDRNQALAMLCAWHLWLCKEGSLIIETPDFEQAIKRLLRTRDYVTRQQILRHVFGSHEAFWAIHCDGWFKEKFERTLTTLGFEIESVHQYSWLMTDNIIVRAKKKIATNYSIEELKRIAKMILKESTIDDSGTEKNMLEVFYSNFERLFDAIILSR